MMRKILIALLFVSLLFAADLGSFTDGVIKNIKDQTDPFIDGAGAAGKTLPQTFDTVFDSFGPGNCGDQWMSASGGLSSIIGIWLLPSIFVVMIVVIGISILYMFGQLFSSPNLIALAKDELYQTGITVLRVGGLIAMLAVGNAFFTLSAVNTGDRVYNGPSASTMIDASMTFSRLMVSDMVTQYSMLLLYNTVIHTIYSSTMWLGLTWRAMYSFNLGPVLRPLIDLLGSTLQFLSLGISEWLLHLVTLCLIKKWMWTLFVPMGMLLRAFPFTRTAGEAIISLAVGLALFYPFMFIFDYEVHKIMKPNIVDPTKAMSGFIQNSGILNVFGSVLVAMFLMAGVFMPFFLGGALTMAFELVRGAVYYIVIMSILLPFFNIFVTLTVSKEMASFYQVDVNFLSFLKII